MVFEDTKTAKRQKELDLATTVRRRERRRGEN